MAVRAKKIQPAKTQAIEEAKKTFADYSDFIFADYRGLTVEQITALRDKLREKNAVLKVVKNNFARIAFEDMKVENVADYLKGPTVVAMAKEDSNEVAKVLFDFAKDAPALAVKGASSLLKGSRKETALRYAYVCNERSSSEACRYIEGLCRQKSCRRCKLITLSKITNKKHCQAS